MGIPVLRIIVDHEVVEELPLAGDVRLGRASDNDVVLRDRAVSGHHGRFESAGEGWRYVDLGSANGSLVAAGPRLSQDETFPLDDVTQIKVGNTVLEFRPPEGGPLAPAPAEVVAQPLLASAEGSASQLELDAADPMAVLHTHPPRPSSPPSTLPSMGDDEPLGGITSFASAGCDLPKDPQATPTPQDALTRTDVAPASQHDPDPVPPAPPADPAELNPRVVVVAGQGAPVTRPLPVPRAVLGRGSDCDVCLDAASVSTRHAEIRWNGGAFEVDDLDSTNGTRLGLGRIGAPTRLPNGSHLILGAVDLLFVYDGPFDGPEGSPVEAEGLLDWLVERNKISKEQAHVVLAAHGSDGRSVEEVLVAEGVLGPGALSELRHNAGRRLLGLSDEQRSALAPAMIWMVLAAIALVTLVVFLLT